MTKNIDAFLGVKKEKPVAQQVKEAAPDDGGGSPQPEVREEAGDPPVSGEGVQSGGQKKKSKPKEVKPVPEPIMTNHDDEDL